MIQIQFHVAHFLAHIFLTKHKAELFDQTYISPHAKFNESSWYF